MIDVGREPMVFWKEKPAEELVGDTESMTPEQAGAYSFIVRRLRLEHRDYREFGLYGVRRFDPEELRLWSRLDTEAWRLGRLSILRPFLFHLRTATIHHPPTKLLYLEWYEEKNRSRDYANKRWADKKKGPHKGPISPPHGPPYPPFDGASCQFTEQNWSKIIEIASKYGISDGGLYPPISNEVSKELTETNDTGSPRLALEGAVRASREIAIPDRRLAADVQRFNAKHDALDQQKKV